MLNDKDNEESKHFKLQKYNKFSVADTIETWKSQILERGGSKMLKPLCEAEPVINIPEIRALLIPGANVAANRNLDIETLALRYSNPSGTAWKRFTEQRNNIEEYKSNNAKIFGLVKKACQENVEVSNYIKQVESNTPANARHYMKGNDLIAYILANFNRESNIHRALIENEIHNLKIVRTASEFLIRLDKLILEAKRLGSTIDSDEITESLLTRNLMSHPNYVSFYQVILINNPIVPGAPNNARLNNIKLLINQYDENHRILKGNKKGETGYQMEIEKDSSNKLKSNIPEEKLKDYKCYKCGKMGHLKKDCNSSTKQIPKFNRYKHNKGTKAFKVKNYNKGCYKCGGNHKSADCNYDYKRKVNFDLNKKKREERAYISIDDIELQPEETDDSKMPRLIDDDEDEYACMLHFENEDEQSDKDMPSLIDDDSEDEYVCMLQLESEDEQSDEDMPSLIDDDSEDEYGCMLQLESEDELESDEDDNESDGYGSSSKVYSSKIADTFDDSDSKNKKRKLEDTDYAEMNRISGLIKFEQIM